MQNTEKTEIISKLTKLKNISLETSRLLELDGLPITNIPKERLFAFNIKSITYAVEGLLRGEATEKHFVRLKMEILDSYKNIEMLKTTKQGKENSENLNQIKELIKSIEENYEKL